MTRRPHAESAKPLHILALGSARQASELKAAANRLGRKVVIEHVAEDVKDWHPREVDDILDDSLKAIARLGMPVAGIVNFGRATVPDGIRRIADVCERLMARGDVPNDAKIVGPSAEAARIWADKSLIAQALHRIALPIPRTADIDTDSANELRNLIDSGDLTLPLVIKVPDLTGGSGMRYAATALDAFAAIGELGKISRQLVACEFVSGDEVSVDLLRLGNEALLFPPGFKRATDTALTHADHKIKVSGTVRRVPRFERDVLTIANAFDLHGFFSLEAVVTGTSPMSWRILEGATRVTNNIQMQDVSLGTDSLAMVIRYLGGEDWLPSEPDRLGIALSIPIYRHRGSASVAALAGVDWVRQVKLEDLALMPDSSDDRVRLTVKMAVDGLNRQLETLVEATGDVELPSRVIAEIERIGATYG